MAASSGSLNASLEFLSFTPLFYPVWRRAGKHAARWCAARDAGNKMRAVELNCGTGGLSRALLRCGFQCTAVEKDTWLLQEAGHHFHKAELRNEVELLLYDGLRTPLAPQSFDIAVNFFGLHCRTEQEQTALLDEMQRLAPACLIIDWQMAERNLHIPAGVFFEGIAFLLCEAANRAKRKQYSAAGSLEGVLFRERARLHVVERDICLGGSMGIALGFWTKEGEDVTNFLACP